MAIEAVIGFAGVIVGALAASLTTIYRERLAARQDLQRRDHQYERERLAARNAFQRESILQLQSAASELMKAAYAELDRLLDTYSATTRWSTRQWETPTAVGWSEALLALQTARARVFDEELRSIADSLRTSAANAIWADSPATAKEYSDDVEPTFDRLNARVSAVLPTLY
jgi:hypothetical protein